MLSELSLLTALGYGIYRVPVGPAESAAQTMTDLTATVSATVTLLNGNWPQEGDIVRVPSWPVQLIRVETVGYCDGSRLSIEGCLVEPDLYGPDEVLEGVQAEID